MVLFYLSGIDGSREKYINKISPKDDELIKVIDMINYFSSKNIDVYHNVNNHYEGSAPLTIQKIFNIFKTHS